jgi:hypothetical protein
MKAAGVEDLAAMKMSGHLTREIFDRYNIITERDVRRVAEKIERFDAERKKSARAANCVGSNSHMNGHLTTCGGNGKVN